MAESGGGGTANANCQAVFPEFGWQWIARLIVRSRRPPPVKSSTSAFISTLPSFQHAEHDTAIFGLVKTEIAANIKACDMRCRFRTALGQAGLAQPIMAEVNRQLDARGLVLKRGTIMDATLMPPRPHRPRREGQVTERDPQAGMAARKGDAVYGYEAHVAADEGSGLVHDVLVTSADTHGSLAFAALIQGDEARRLCRPRLRQCGQPGGAGRGRCVRPHHASRPPQPSAAPLQRWHSRMLAPIRSGIKNISSAPGSAVEACAAGAIAAWPATKHT